MRRLAALLLALSGCGSDPSGSPSGTPCDLTIDGVAKTALLSPWTAVLQADDGIVLAASGSVDDLPLSFSVDISGGTPVVPGAALPVGGSSVNVRMTLGETVYRGTEGELLFSAYGTDPGNPVAGELDIGLVGIVLPRTAARIRAAFDADLTLP